MSDIDGTNLREPSHTGPQWTGSAQARMSWTLTHESGPEILKLWDVSWMNPTLSHKLVIRDTNYQINQDSVESDSFFIRLIERKQFWEDSSSSVTTAFDDSAFPDSQILFRAFFCCDLSFNVFRSFHAALWVWPSPLALRTLLRVAVDRSARADFPNVIVLIRYDSLSLVRSYTIYNTKSNWLQSPALILATWFPSLF